MFLRDKNGVYKIDSDDLTKYYVKYSNHYCADTLTRTIILGAYNKGDKDIKVSKSIEKLCDEFVGLVKDKTSDFVIMKVISHSLKELKNSLKTELNGKVYNSKFDITYGAIWTDKGLIYVSKMNEKGELELI